MPFSPLLLLPLALPYAGMLIADERATRYTLLADAAAFAFRHYFR